MEEIECLRMASISIRVEMKNMVNKLLRQEEEMMKIGNNKDVSEHTETVHAGTNREHIQLKIGDIVLRAPV